MASSIITSAIKLTTPLLFLMLLSTAPSIAAPLNEQSADGDELGPQITEVDLVSDLISGLRAGRYYSVSFPSHTISLCMLRNCTMNYYNFTRLYHPF
jgi:hypothetical protein